MSDAPGGIRRRVTPPLRRLWSGKRDAATLVLAVVTAPISALFGTAVRARNALYDAGVFRSVAAPIPVISVGNIAVGGTGKTPVSSWLVGELAKRKWKPALVLRGYGEDELLLHRRWHPEIPVIRSPNRRAGIGEAVAQGRDIVVLDDGFQHRSVRRDLDLVLLSPAQALPARLLPRGPFREPLRALLRANFVLVTAKGPGEAGTAGALSRVVSSVRGAPPVRVFPLRSGPWRTIEGEVAAPPNDSVPMAVSSIAEPESFVRTVEERMGARVESIAFPDHHAYSEEDARRIARAAGSRWIAITEKDAVKLASFRSLLPDVRVLPLTPAPDAQVVEGILEALGHRAPPERGATPGTPR